MASPADIANGSSTVRVSLVRNGRTVEVTLRQITTENLRKMFQVNPSDAWLRDECDGTVYLPEQNGDFKLDQIGPYTALVVEGPTLSPGFNMRAGLSSTSGRSQQAMQSSLPPAPMFRSVIASKKVTFSLKVLKARMVMTRKGKKPEFETTGQMYVDLTDSTANISHIRGKIQEQWGAEYTIVTTEGLEIEDSSATQGMTFWKSPRRRLFAVTYSNIKGTKRSASTSFDDYEADSSDDNFEETPRRKKKADDKVQLLLDEMMSTKELLIEMATLSSDSELPIPFKRLINDTFKCCICHSVPMKPPVIVAKCCKNMLGCQGCVDRWYSGPDQMTKLCPICRTDRAYSDTMVLRGLSEFLDNIRKIYCRNEDDENAEGIQEEQLNN